MTHTLLLLALLLAMPARAATPPSTASFDAETTRLVGVINAHPEDPRGWVMMPTLQVMARIRDGRVAAALIAALEKSGKKFDTYRPNVRHALALLAGKDLGGQAGPWRDWGRGAFGK